LGLLQGLTLNKENNTVNRLGQIQKKKQELYSIIAECEQDSTIGRIGRQNGQLLELLSVQVDPKPSDLRWYCLLTLEDYTSIIFFSLC
jgi:hypothetical protein